MSVCVCAKCKKPWKMSSSPAICPLCNQVSFAIAVPEMSATIKKRGQDPEYRAKQSAIHTGKRHTAETKAKISTALTRFHNERG